VNPTVWRKRDILLFLRERNLCIIFDFCTTYGSRQASIKERVSSWQFEVSSQRGQAEQPPASNFTRHTSDSPPTGTLGGRCMQNEPNLARAPGNGRGPAGRDARPESETCKTNPISPARGRSPEGKCAKRTQFGPAGQGVPGREASGAKSQVSGQEGPPCRPPTSNCAPQTSHFPTGNVQNEANRWRAEMALTAVKDKGYGRRTAREPGRKQSQFPQRAGVRYLFGKNLRKSWTARDLVAAPPAALRRRCGFLLGTDVVESSHLAGGFRTRGVPPEVRSG
jgi:hypothetical protein